MSQQSSFMNGGQSPLASKLKASDLAAPEHFTQLEKSTAAANNGGEAHKASKA